MLLQEYAGQKHFRCAVLSLIVFGKKWQRLYLVFTPNFTNKSPILPEQILLCHGKKFLNLQELVAASNLVLLSIQVLCPPKHLAMHEKCPSSEFSWSASCHFRTEFGDLFFVTITEFPNHNNFITIIIIHRKTEFKIFRMMQ